MESKKPNNRRNLSGMLTVNPKKTDIHGYKRRLELAFEKIEVEESFNDTDKRLVREFGHYLLAVGQNPGRVAKVIFQLFVLKRHMDVEFVKADRASIERVLLWLNGYEGYTAWTKSDAKGHLKRFYKWIRYQTTSQEQPFPPEVAWFSTRVKLNEIKEPETFTTQEVESMIRVAYKIRDKAFIAISNEGGFRIGETLGMKIGDVRFDEHGARAMVTGKTGPRPVRLITSASLLTRYIEEHPLRDNLQAPLWLSLSRRYPDLRCTSYHSIQIMLKQIAKKAGVNKRVHTHMFRHTAATRDAPLLTEAQLRIKYGWSKSSDSPSTYVHLSARDVDSKLISVYSGKTLEYQKPEFSPIICPRCSERNTPGLKYCGRCGSPLDPEKLAVASIAEFQSSMRLEAVEKKLQEALGQRKFEG